MHSIDLCTNVERVFEDMWCGVWRGLEIVISAIFTMEQFCVLGPRPSILHTFVDFVPGFSWSLHRGVGESLKNFEDPPQDNILHQLISSCEADGMEWSGAWVHGGARVQVWESVC